MSEIQGSVQGLCFSSQHEWVKKESGLYLIGISDYAQKALGDIVYLDISVKENTIMERGANFGFIESVKAVEDLYAPLSAKLVAINFELKSAPEKINQDPYASWIVKIKPSGDRKLKQDLKELMDEKAYAEYIKSLS